MAIRRNAGHLTRNPGRVRYDVLFMTLCVYVIGFYAAFIEMDDWEMRQLLFWSHVLYGLLSLPFLLTMLPVAALQHRTSNRVHTLEPMFADADR